MTVIEQLNKLKTDHYYILTKLRKTEHYSGDGRVADYWKGALNTIEHVLDVLGVDYEDNYKQIGG